jgi:hypothetical protein
VDQTAGDGERAIDAVREAGGILGQTRAR